VQAPRILSSSRQPYKTMDSVRLLADPSLFWRSKALPPTLRMSPRRVEWPESSVLALSQLAWAHLKAVGAIRLVGASPAYPT